MPEKSTRLITGKNDPYVASQCIGIFRETQKKKKQGRAFFMYCSGGGFPIFYGL
jgi:hypothetical protein